MAFSMLAFCQGKETPKHVLTEKQAKPYLDSLKKLDSLGKILDQKNTKKADTSVLHIDLHNRVEGEIILKALQAGYTAMPLSEQITAAQFTNAKINFEYLMSIIFKKWPDLIPKQPKQ